MSRKEVLVVGGGSAGALVALRLLQSGGSDLVVTLAEPTLMLGRGVAYSTTDPRHLLNVPAGKMSAYPEHPSDFLTWLVQRGEGSEEELAGKFVRRGLFGQYVATELEKAIESSAAEFRHVAKRVSALESTGRKLTAQVGDSRIKFDHVVLALGNTRPRMLPQLAAFASDSRVVLNPWNSASIGQVDVNDDVLIVGTGLTFVDTALALAARGHKGKIVGISKSGLLAHRHAPAQPVELGPLPSTDLVGWVIQGARAAGDNWRGFIDALRPHSVKLWQSLSWDERRRFIARLSGYWDVHRHRMPPSQAEELSSLLESGQVRVIRSHLPLVTDLGGKLGVAFSTGEERFDRIISCTGPDMYWSRQRIPLLETTVVASLAEYDPLGIGLIVVDDGRVGDSGTLWAIGNLCRGCRWETTAIPELRVQAKRLAECVLDA